HAFSAQRSAMARRGIAPVPRSCRRLARQAWRPHSECGRDHHLRTPKGGTTPPCDRRQARGDSRDRAGTLLGQGDHHRGPGLHRSLGGHRRASCGQRAPAGRRAAMKLNFRRPDFPAGISVWHPASLVAHWFGAGLMPFATGTWGSLAALPFAAVISWLFGAVGLAVATVAVSLLGWWASEALVRRGD